MRYPSSVPVRPAAEAGPVRTRSDSRMGTTLDLQEEDLQRIIARVIMALSAKLS